MATSLKLIKIKDYPFQAIKTAKPVFDKNTLGAMWNSVFALQREIKDRTPVGAGPAHLKDSILADVRGEPVNLRGSVSTAMLYGEPVEYGAKPHMPPYYPIYYWVTRKLGLAGAEAKRAAMAIRWKIFKVGASSWQLRKQGTKGAEMFKRGWEAAEPRIIAYFEQAAEKIRAHLEGD